MSKITSENYVSAARRTEYESYEPMKERLNETALMRLLHSGMGMCTEAGEFQDALKRKIFYNKDLDLVNLAEEIGDMLWYCAIACDILGISLDSVMEKNIDKLKVRYPNKFTEENAINRNLDEERKVLADTKINLCDKCENIQLLPGCLADNVKFGDGFGNDNVIECSNYKEAIQ